MQITNRQVLKYIFILAIFLLSIYTGSLITFYNNDDWVHYKTVENFLGGEFTLHPYIGSTFFAQGILAYFFAKAFSIRSLPILTILISVVNVFVFYSILNLISPKKTLLRILVLLFLVINPLYLYSSVGFMTENYVLLFLLLAIYFHLRFQQTQQFRNTVYENISYILGFFVKQYTVFLSFASIIYFAIKKKWAPFMLSSISTLTILSYYYFLFPKNNVLANQSFNVDLPGLPQLFFNILLYLTFFTLPLNIILIFKLKTHRLWTITLCAIILFLNLKLLPLEEFPSLTNVLTRKGLFPDIDGNKSHWAGYHKFFTYSYYISITISSLLLAKIILSAKYIYTRSRYLSVAFILYLGLCLILPYFYDRYLLPLLVLWLLILYTVLARRRTQEIGILIAAIWLATYTFFSYLYISDYVIRNIRISDSSTKLVSEGIPPQAISADRSWNNYYEINPESVKYIYSFDDPTTFDQLPNSTLYKTISVDFPMNIFTNSKIYLYRANEN